MGLTRVLRKGKQFLFHRWTMSGCDGLIIPMLNISRPYIFQSWWNMSIERFIIDLIHPVLNRIVNIISLEEDIIVCHNGVQSFLIFFTSQVAFLLVISLTHSVIHFTTGSSSFFSAVIDFNLTGWIAIGLLGIVMVLTTLDMFQTLFL